MIGARFGRLVVIADAGMMRGSRHWRCLCDCGTSHIANQSNLKSGKIKSCGCLHRDNLRKKNMSHGMTRTSEYRIWADMIKRCYNRKHPSYYHYGGRGIAVCDEWKTFSGFISDMGFRPSREYSLDRIENNTGYSPANCRWATRAEQSNNKRTTIKLTAYGQSKTAKEWAEITGLNQKLITERKRRGWTDEAAVSMPKLSGVNGHSRLVLRNLKELEEG